MAEVRIQEGKAQRSQRKKKDKGQQPGRIMYV